MEKKLKKGDYVINQYQIQSITSLIDGTFTVDFDGSVGKIEEIEGFKYGKYSYRIKRNGKIESEIEDDLILVKPEIEEP